MAPGTTTVNLGATQQFSATVTNTTDAAVTWSVNGIAEWKFERGDDH